MASSVKTNENTLLIIKVDGGKECGLTIEEQIMAHIQAGIMTNQEADNAAMGRTTTVV